ncbi:hypothetical protein KPB2_5543 [Klebsiella pneumoniae Kb677]|nr:hypothetical protein KPB2_5543 [Klebsiella pneumoniae Kb677]
MVAAPADRRPVGLTVAPQVPLAVDQQVTLLHVAQKPRLTPAVDLFFCVALPGIADPQEGLGAELRPTAGMWTCLLADVVAPRPDVSPIAGPTGPVRPQRLVRTPITGPCLDALLKEGRAVTVDVILALR